jgi:hypothetical protein
LCREGVSKAGMQLGRLLVVAGLVLVVMGAAVIALTKLNLPLGRLPGDFVWRGKNSVIYFPWVTCLVLSVVGTLVMWLLRRR